VRYNDFMITLLEHKYTHLLAAHLENFRNESSKLYNFRCPFCGDSSNDKTKARGYLFEADSSVFYKCHNCGVSASFQKFLQFVNPALATSYKIDRLRDIGQGHFADEPDPEAVDPRIKLRDVGCIPISQMDEDTKAVSYLKSRKIPRDKWNSLYYIRDASRLSELNSAYKNRIVAEERIVIPFHDSRGNLSGVTARALGNSKLRYLTVRLSQYPMIYGLSTIQKGLPIYVCEGAFDSMFLQNAIAVGGSDLMRAVGCLPDCNLIFIFDNEPRNASIVKLMERRIAQNHKIVIWPQSWKHKDINEAVIAGVDNASLLEVIYINTFSGLQSRLAIRDWKKV